MVFVGPMNLFSNMIFAIYLVYAVRELGLTATTIGVIFSLGSVGSLVGALTANRIARTLGIGPSLIATSSIGSRASPDPHRHG
jgi:MFS-type transporter involved in bile tolerance (Atg22 family)